MLYMQEVERMDGYGEESYPAKVSGTLKLGCSTVRLGSQAWWYVPVVSSIWETAV
jgi:hypothetical protein